MPVPSLTTLTLTPTSRSTAGVNHIPHDRGGGLASDTWDQQQRYY
jgi:hypothetical protein